MFVKLVKWSRNIFHLIHTLGQAIFYIYSCWISTDQGAIWGFAGPMIAIIIVRLFLNTYYVNHSVK